MEHFVPPTTWDELDQLDDIWMAQSFIFILEFVWAIFGEKTFSQREARDRNIISKLKPYPSSIVGKEIIESQ